MATVPASLDRLQFAPPQPPGMLRAYALAVIAHLLLMSALTWGINWNRDPVTVSAEAELWSSLPQEAAPRLVEPPAPIPAPTPPPVPVAPEVKPEPKPEPAPREAEIALEREKEQQAQARRKQLALEREQKREAERELAAKKKANEEKKLARAKAAEEKQKLETGKLRRQADDAKRIEAQREDNLRRMQEQAKGTGRDDSRGAALRSSGPSASYAGRVAARIKPNIVFTEEISGNPRAEIEVRVAPDGTIVGQRLLKSSGVRSWDEAVLKAIIKTEVLPRDIDGRVPSPLIIDFRPKD